MSCIVYDNRDSSGHVPYVVTKEKSVRDCYRRFMGQWPDIYDYTTSQIPSPLTNDMERQRREKVKYNNMVTPLLKSDVCVCVCVCVCCRLPRRRRIRNDKLRRRKLKRRPNEKKGRLLGNKEKLLVD